MPPVLSPTPEVGLLAARSAMRPTEQIRAAAEPWRLHLVESKRWILARRNTDGSDSMLNLMIGLLALALCSLVLASLLFVFYRRRRLQRLRNGTLPKYQDVRQNPHGHSLTIETTRNGHSSVYYIGQDGQPMLQNPHSPPHSPDNVPEIHITFPDEHDENGRPQSGRVLVVRVGDNATVGLEPMKEEQLPAYEKEAKGQFQSIDMDQIGGLKEKDRTRFQ